jgi:hypothetical protein
MKLLLLFSIVFINLNLGFGQDKLISKIRDFDFDYCDINQMEKLGHNTVFTYEFKKDTLILIKKHLYNFNDSTFSVTNKSDINKRNKVTTISIYDPPNEKVEGDFFNPQILHTKDSLDRIIESIVKYQGSSNLPTHITNFIYFGDSWLLKYRIKEVIQNDNFVNSAYIEQFDYYDNLIYFERYKYITKRENSNVKSYLEKFSKVNEDGLLIYEKTLNENGTIKSEYKFTYE